ncbi:hypothetical protein FDI69_gp196 [Rhodococcus phage Trina]|uniref:Uncharacterized protein n=1 Tax=Rhodococcus phage Trina TaxID=2027905 RepID=A0A2D1A6W2_9CAUD|nr:hypothetical protein FDI69_gp196 [Rhodococcus phage Trina]ASZ74990.1 hypothetical protein SEA_TRINA_211 [Rhodococcus phage Trina]
MKTLEKQNEFWQYAMLCVAICYLIPLTIWLMGGAGIGWIAYLTVTMVAVPVFIKSQIIYEAYVEELTERARKKDIV